MDSTGFQYDSYLNRISIGFLLVLKGIISYFNQVSIGFLWVPMTWGDFDMIPKGFQ